MQSYKEHPDFNKYRANVYAELTLNYIYEVYLLKSYYISKISNYNLNLILIDYMLPDNDIK